MTSDGGQSSVVETLTELITPVCDDLGYELVEVQFRREAHGLVLRIVIFRKTGIGIDDCTKISREVSDLLDVEDLIDQPYHLEVSSPGLDWPLKTARDFNRYKGEQARISFREGEAVSTVEGEIIECNDAGVLIKTEKGDMLVPLAHIAKAKLIIVF